MPAARLQELQLPQGFVADGQRAPIARDRDLGGQRLQRLAVQRLAGLPDVRRSDCRPPADRGVSRSQPGGAANIPARQAETLGDLLQLADLMPAQTLSPMIAPRI